MGSVISGIFVVVVVVAIVAYVLLRGRDGDGSAEVESAVDRLTVRRPDAEFHVVANAAVVTFEVPLPPGGADPVLRDLLLHQATELMRDRKRRGQPLDGIDSITVNAKAAGSIAEVGTIQLTELNELPEVAMPIPLARTVAEDHDPLRTLEDSDIKKVVPVGDTTALDQLAPVGSDLRLTAGIEAGLRSLGIDPRAMNVVDLGLGLLELAGYRIAPHGKGSYVATGGGRTSYVSFVAHEDGSYPELEASAITSFLVGFSSAGTDRGLLITDKFGPYLVYEKEKSNPKCRFITRERLQAFVDSIALS
jgi:hypothetical protein